MGICVFGRAVGRFAAVEGLAIVMCGCSMALEDPPKAMYGTTAWSDAWQLTCSNDSSGSQSEKLGAEHLDKDCYQYQVAQQMRYQEPRVAQSQPH